MTSNPLFDDEAAAVPGTASRGAAKSGDIGRSVNSRPSPSSSYFSSKDMPSFLQVVKPKATRSSSLSQASRVSSSSHSKLSDSAPTPPASAPPGETCLPSRHRQHNADSVVAEGQFVVLVTSQGRRFVVRVPEEEKLNPSDHTGENPKPGQQDTSQAEKQTTTDPDGNKPRKDSCAPSLMKKRRDTGEKQKLGWFSSSSSSPSDFPLEQLIGHPFYSSFLLRQGVWILDEDESAGIADLLTDRAHGQRGQQAEEEGEELNEEEEKDDDEEEEETGEVQHEDLRRTKKPRRGLEETFCSGEEAIMADNRDLLDDNASQQLTAARIECLRAQGIKGEELIGLLVASSSSFRRKTKFSQEKYIRKKMARHLERITVLPATVREVCEAYYVTDPVKISHLRFDYLSSLLIQANLSPGSRALVFDHAMGLVTGAVALRLCGAGRVWRITDRGCSDKINAELNLSATVRDTIFNIPLEAAERWEMKRQQRRKECPTSDTPHASGEPSSREGDQSEEGRGAPVSRFHTELEDLYDGGVDSAIIVLGLKKAIKTTPADALPFLRQLGHRLALLAFKLLRPEGSLVVFCHNWEVASAIHAAANGSREFVHVQMQEFFLREQQVGSHLLFTPCILPRRTHPVMNSSLPLVSGFLVSAIRMQPESAS
ncbi:eukaryotic initiation factor gamma subunit protein [Cystoisospora suis]|uniref:tRNA (adenine(58)-N(1))-methyltransferase non-catalytic subunit TRM6 n=1 Tax=Cystoisospora suis TaxID=483139 RepID=A0A2C6L1D7_9APIC|nr:eukaryotic initiation factor gamma subunit protein [Cystoisospora suis]